MLHLDHPEKETTFVDFAALVDDGEAMTAALALHRRAAVATDDRKAGRVFAQRAPSVHLVSTLELLKQWAERASVTTGDLRSATLSMQSGASYIPGERDPLYEWWRAVMYGRTVPFQAKLKFSRQTAIPHPAGTSRE